MVEKLEKLGFMYCNGEVMVVEIVDDWLIQAQDYSFWDRRIPTPQSGYLLSIGIDNACSCAYTVFMNSRQYTIRSIPPKVDQILRKRAKSTGKSFNQVVIEALSKGAGVTESATFNDLDWFIGGHSLEDKSFDTAVEWLDSLPKDIE